MNIANIQKLSQDLTSAGLTFTNCELLAGGYCLNKGYVIIEMRIKTTATVSDWSTLVTGILHTGGREVPLNALCVNGGSGQRFLDCANNTIRKVFSTMNSSEEINLSGVYLWRGW